MVRREVSYEGGEAINFLVSRDKITRNILFVLRQQHYGQLSGVQMRSLPTTTEGYDAYGGGSGKQ